MCEPQNRDNGASDLWTLTAYRQEDFTLCCNCNHVTLGSMRGFTINSGHLGSGLRFTM